MRMETARPLARRRWLRRSLVWGGIVVALLLSAFTAVGGWGIVAAMRKPDTPFDAKRLPPRADYTRKAAWLAWPGRNGPERSTPPRIDAIAEVAAPADVFFVHPTTFKGNKVWLAASDASAEAAPLNTAVLLGQASVFNGCCRIYAPRYRQATLAGLSVPAAMDVAYADVAAAFRHFVSHANRSRPFIIASHSQGTAHAIRLLQEEVLGRPKRRRLVAAVLIGGYVPDTFGELGLPICDGPRQTGCALSYNTAETGRGTARIVIDDKSYWWRGRLKTTGQATAACVNPLTWRREGAAPASANSGSLPFPEVPFATAAMRLPTLIPHLTGAVCRDGMLDVDVPWSAPSGFVTRLSIVFGSYHLNDYGFFYARLRQNVAERVAAWRRANAGEGVDIPGITP